MAWYTGYNRLVTHKNHNKEKTHFMKDTNPIEEMIDFITERYSLRYNTLTACAEFRPTNADADSYMPLDTRTRKRITLEVQREGIAVSQNDIANYIDSDYIRSYNPIDTYLDTCEGTWDGKDHIAELAATVPTDTPLWKEWFTTWFIAMVNQWRHCPTRLYGNSVAPLLISPQGYNKSTFCRRLLPKELAWGYTDNIAVSEKRQMLNAMSQQLLINLDEFNQISARLQQGFLKNIIQLPTVKMKRPYGTRVEDLPRTASFIATSNMTDILSDPSGNRRFIGVELTAPIDISNIPDHRQLFAQALQMLRNGQRCWFDKKETERIMEWNRRFEIREPIEQYFRLYFAPAKEPEKTDEKAAEEESGTKAKWLSAAEIFDTLKSNIGSSLKVSSLMNFGRKLANMPDLQKRRFNSGMRYLVKHIARQQ